MAKARKRNASALPRKQFFRDMFTRDIAVEDCILDLVDNSIDGLIRSRKIDLRNIVLSASEGLGSKDRPTIDIVFDEGKFEISDKCGGLDIELAVKEAFNFGHKHSNKDTPHGSLGVYGVGMKRAIFKIGSFFRISSQTTSNGFEAEWDIDKWVEKDDKLEDWRLPLTPIKAASTLKTAGTKIEITRINSAVSKLLGSETLEKNLRDNISRTYALFVGRFVDVRVNGTLVHADPIPLSEGAAVENARERITDGDVDVLIVAGLQARDPKRDEWNGETAGWYVLCNGRTVVTADRSKLTGWGAGTLPLWHSGKFRAFIGVICFNSSNALRLPWTTTKRGLNQESAIWQRAKVRAEVLGKQVTSFIDSLYRPDDDEKPNIPALQESLSAADVRDIAKQIDDDPKPFKATAPKIRATKKDKVVTVSFPADRKDVDAVKLYLRNTRMSNAKMGKQIFKYFMSAHDIEAIGE